MPAGTSVDYSEYTDVDDDRAVPSSAVMPPLPPATTNKSDILCPRLTWAILHTVGVGLLYLAGGWHFPCMLPLDAVTVLVLLTTILYIAAAMVDPGYLPRGSSDGKSSSGGGSGTSRGPLSTPLLDHPQCMHCLAHQVLRAKHCHDCGRCVRQLDHHCWWLGNCVGAGNHRLFIAYLMSETTLVGVVAVGAVRGVPDDAGAASVPIPAVSGPAAVACVGLCATIGLLSITLLLFQLALIARGETTWEHLRRERINAAANLPPHVRPYDRGCWRNVLAFTFAGLGSPPVAHAVPIVGPSPAVGPAAVAVPAGTQSGRNAAGARA